MNPAPTPVAPARTAPLAPRHDRSAWQMGAVVVIWLTSLIAVALWLSGGGVENLLSLGSGTLMSIGRLSGLISANLMLFQVLLMAQVPLFERGFGRAGITRMHRLVGIWSFVLMIVHVVLIVVAYAMQSRTNPIAELWDQTLHYPGVLLSEIGVIALVVVMISSARRARSRLRYERWHLLHLWGYLGVGLAIPHMLWTGSDFVGHPIATAYWWTLWGLTAACVVVFRIVMPPLRSWHHDLRVAQVLPDGSHGVTVRISGRRLAGLGTQAGQFFTWRFLDGPGWTRGHPFSLSAAPTDTSLQISARMVGDGTRRLTRLRPGTRVLVEGPFGHMTGDERSGRGLLMLGAGAGVAPLVSLLEDDDFRPGAAVLITRDHAATERMRAGAIQRLIDRRGLVHYALDGPRARTGTAWIPGRYAGWRGDELLRRLCPGTGRLDPTDIDVYVCGPDPWMAEVLADLRTAGFPSDNVHSESFNPVPEGSAHR